MKILILTAPFCGGENFALSIANELDYKVIIDPIKPRPKEMMFPRNVHSEYPPLKADIYPYAFSDRKPWPTEVMNVAGIWHSPLICKISLIIQFVNIL